MPYRFAACLALVAVITACGARVRPMPATGPKSTFVSTAPGVHLEVLDWGGSGRPLVFLGGGGHTAREFDEFAPQFANRFRVLGISRRGSGSSSDVPPESLDVLVEDIVSVLDSLRLGSAVLVGHSFAGAELALFGEKHPDRCMGLIYLDAAYDYTDPDLGKVFEAAPPPQAPEMQAADSASVGAVQAWVERTQGFRLPETEIRATRQFDPSGKLVGVRLSSTQQRLPSLLRAPRWEAVECPALGMYAVPAPPETWLPYYDELSPDQRTQAQAYFRAFSRWTAASREDFARQPQNVVAEFPGTGHYFFLEAPQEAARAMLEFLAQLR